MKILSSNCIYNNSKFKIYSVPEIRSLSNSPEVHLWQGLNCKTIEKMKYQYNEKDELLNTIQEIEICF